MGLGMGVGVGHIGGTPPPTYCKDDPIQGVDRSRLTKTKIGWLKLSEGYSVPTMKGSQSYAGTFMTA